MFTVVDTYDNLPTNVEEESKFFVSNDNTIYVYSNGVWITYESFVGGFDLISSVSISDTITIDEEAFIFTDTPYFDNYKINYYYPIVFTASSIEPINSEFATISIMDNFETTHTAMSYPKTDNLYIKYYYCIQPIGFENNLNLINTNHYEQMFNVSVSNGIISGPIVLNLYKPIGV
jgi:hypothetical protein